MWRWLLGKASTPLLVETWLDSEPALLIALAITLLRRRLLPKPCPWIRWLEWLLIRLLCWGHIIRCRRPRKSSLRAKSGC